ncbi:MAG: hypothetical protein ACI4J6_11005 [Oscillospiraceae bacterium]
MKMGKIAVRLKNRYALRIAVKEALNTLPTAVCYFNPSGTVKLCNTVMYDLFRKIAQSDLQSIDELKEALDGCDKSTGIVRDGNLFLFPDGRVWQYSAEEVKTADGKVYTETMFNDVTELYEKRQELKQQSRELKKMYKELKSLSESVQEATREQEILNMKSRLHDQMNMGVAAIRQILRQNTTSEENAAAVAQFRRAIQVLQEENAYPQDDVTEFIRDAAVSGIQVNITGNLPETGETVHLLLPVMREACVNAARHADAAMLYVTVEQSPDTITLCMTNDGKQPEEEITPRGGLVDLGKVIAEAGGRMEFRSQPAFALTVTLPICK